MNESQPDARFLAKTFKNLLYFVVRSSKPLNVKNLKQFTAIMLFFGGLILSARAGFSSIYIWGDSLSTTTSNSPSSQYYGRRESNGRTWVEVLAQRQGLGANSTTNVNWSYSSNNLSYYGHYSSSLVADIKNFKVPANATNCLFVVWLNNADFVGDMTSIHVGDPANAPNNGTNLANWTSAINQHLTNHFNFITNLYALGCRTLIAPNAADVTTIPQFNSSSAAYRNFVRQRIISFNTSNTVMLNGIQTSTNFPGLKIYVPDIFSLLDNVLTNAPAYGLTNALDYYGHSIAAIDDLNPNVLYGPGTNYVFWDRFGSPTAKMGEIIADVAQQSVSPAQISISQISNVTLSNGSNLLNVAMNMVNLPVGLNGFVDGSTNLAQPNWILATNFNSTATSQSISVLAPPFPTVDFGSGGGSGGSGGSSGPPMPGSGTGTTSGSNYVSFTTSAQFYRLRFPFAWNWP
jgi:phospholipase/lecithinase/hemolysin